MIARHVDPNECNKYAPANSDIRHREQARRYGWVVFPTPAIWFFQMGCSLRESWSSAPAQKLRPDRPLGDGLQTRSRGSTAAVAGR